MKERKKQEYARGERLSSEIAFLLGFVKYIYVHGCVLHVDKGSQERLVGG